MKITQRFFAVILCVMLLCASLISVGAADNQETKDDNKISVLSCDTLDGWTSDGELALDTEDETEGDACISATLDAPANSAAILSVRATFDAINITDAYLLEFDFYISNPALMWASRMMILDFGSAGSPDSELATWYENAFNGIDKAGWYHISLPMSEASSRGFRASDLNYFCLQFFQVNSETDLNDVVVKIDNVTATKGERNYISADNCDTAEGWSDWGAHPTSDTANKKEGAASLCFQLNIPEEPNLVSQKVYEPINATGLTYVEMDIFISDVNVFKNSKYAIQFEITSSGTCDHQEYSWSLDDYVTKNGWTHISMPVTDATNCDGVPNLAAVNYLRFHTLNITQASGGVFTFRVDNITFVTIKQGNAPYGATPIVREPDVDDPPTENPGIDVPGIDQPGVEQPGVDQPDNNESTLRARQTAQRAKVLLLLMIFTIIGIDAVVVALKRKKEKDATVAVSGDGQPPAPEE
ncbi:MAG: hypothetical protein IKY29_03690 [Clostridia bacterium]|nr:hypothetical protein [Clostridia bacterium]